MITVYLICAEINNEKLYKIGYTRRDINKRVGELKTGNAAEFYIVDSFNSKWGTKIEALVHKRFGSKKVNGEWFRLTDDDIPLFKDHCISIHENLEVISESNTYYQDRGNF